MSSDQTPAPTARSVAASPGDLARAIGRRVLARLTDHVGGPARGRVILLFACVLALNSADISTVGAVAGELEPALGIGNTEVGLLSSVTLLVGAIAVIPVGLMVDRLRRIPLLAGSILIWSVAMFASGLAGSYSTLLIYRVALGAVARPPDRRSRRSPATTSPPASAAASMASSSPASSPGPPSGS